MDSRLYLLIGASVAVAFLIGVFGERYVARQARSRWKAKNSGSGKPQPAGPVTDAVDQLRIVMNAAFEARPILSKAEARVLYSAERAITARKLPWRVMAQVSLGEVLSSSSPAAYATINSKRVDLLIVGKFGEPILAIEYQGGGHYQGTAAARDAVKREALRRAGVHYFEVTPQQPSEDLEREVARLAEVR